ncbi:MAG: acetyl/propionyl/methylcrotonyl-CoA carboxylase subunit alpha [Gammaproteobacteria bacterium]|nr:acetyl/propionyl/methylcrotonyl-CoA carboxylase subunit alpha [Gammaproteobacteria bacterium]MCP4089416.1 acetyl/propionyl/methylcrotonyl-CoA carboxylase subunit alpha [Gammaproteobacteria bacterium]MCP4277531.1 acetyl/propionyl/methylcrotonyl-CoA carboxylase subunit alpha [Gammaproteobacteria bacterium]MCP4831139.1 acetyl/propionyl/methylcrotonyl-CoA carboxylase subunit alpha [Gammaproteobacteria bacterium]MCP4928562.1 acetyl/propionyl/methylcrotonyl-CoA carboxylase subunit alpha [Gammaprot
MFDKILIANRGEIACRVIKTAKKMGIKTVAVYSDADREALHVRMADEAIHIGPSPSAESYLIADRIIDACKQTGAQAVHPGYGFLSENATFTTALDEAGIAFIGPGNHAITTMGDKITSKKLAEEAGVNTVPGYTDIIDGPDHAVEIARKIGYPVMLKASAGGGGKGMRVVRDDDECRDGFQRAQNEARSSFGDDRVFAEKFIEEPRHIEIQVLADSHGNTIYLGERECSIQRRHQKVIEEAPSPFLNEKTRKAMGEQAVALAKEVQYKSAGTVEFIVDAKRNFYFLEMNTRLQVEHPVTELITGQDLVEWMIRIADGEKLTLKQKDVRLKGWAIETRVYAEDPFRNFMPSIGRLVRYNAPTETAHVRVDTGIEEGSEVSMYYDPMIAKLITYGDDRTEALEHMGEALDAYYIRGVSHNISFLNALIAHPRFIAGNITTNMIAEEYPEGFYAADVPQDNPALAIVIAGAINTRLMDRAAQLSGQVPSHERQVPRDWVAVINQQETALSVRTISGGYDIAVSDELYHVLTDWKPGDALVRATVNGNKVCFQQDKSGAGISLFRRGAQINITICTPRAAELNRHMLEKIPPDLSKFLLSPMPGLLVKLVVKVGEEVKAGEELAVVEAMKMENSLRAENDVVITKIMAEQGDSLVVDQPILEFE